MSRVEMLAIQPALPPSEGDASSVLQSVMQILNTWHNDEHTGAFHLCQLQPCAAVQDEVEWLEPESDD